MTGRPDLAAMIGPLGRELIALEQPILAAHDLTMWAYAVLLHLGPQPVRTQAALAEAIGADKTRIIGVLDDLAARGLISREPDPADRRVRLLAITEQGARRRDAAQAEIQQAEERLLGRLDPAEREIFVAVLRKLTGSL